MSQPLVANGSVNAMDPANAKDVNEINGMKKEVPASPQQTANQPNVRHIPIFVEGRDEPIFNRNLDTTTVDSPITRPPPVINDIPQPGSIFNRVKDIPVKKVVPEFQAANTGTTGSPSRIITKNEVHTESNKTASNTHPHTSQPAAQQPSQKGSHPQQQNLQKHPQTQQINSEQADRRSQSPKPPPVDPITKIQTIQKEVLELMDKVEKYKGGSRKDKEYIYLDEMLTQNLLKLDLIDTEGKENIKAARKEAINCINKCIQVLEAKASAAENAEKQECENTSNENTSLKEQENDQSAENRGNEGNNGTKEEKPPQVQGSST